MAAQAMHYIAINDYMHLVCLKSYVPLLYETTFTTK